jgi:flavin reductase (DIM6/NTAB) family NADH-FMN oxidoreductase RutF
MKALIRKILTGDTPVREYATVTIGQKINERVYLLLNDDRIDISNCQWVFCLTPLVIGVWTGNEKTRAAPGLHKNYRIIFTDSAETNNTVAESEAELVQTIDHGEASLLLFELKHCHLKHLASWRTRLIYQRYYKKPSQPFDRFKSYVTAYSFPRKVRLISFSSADHYNIFPMDLIGELPEQRLMFFGLRHTNRTLGKILETKKLVVSEIPFNEKETIYKMGSHHGVPPVPVAQLPFRTICSKDFQFPVPEWANSYREISIKKNFNLGSHMLIWGEYGAETRLSPASAGLYHIHFLHYLHQKAIGLDYRLV